LSNPVKPKRRYRSNRRAAQAEETRIAILDAAHKLFVENGWSTTTIAAIAKQAGVAQETIYARFGDKRSVAQALVAFAMRGADQKTPFMEQPQRRKVQAQTDPAKRIEALALDVNSILRRVAPVLAVVRSAAESDTEMRDLYLELHEARRRNLAGFVRELAEISGLRSGLDPQMAADHVWLLCSPEMFLLWTGAGGKNAEGHAAWLTDALKTLLLEDGATNVSFER
jgi:AcrR family transcriptional regulator